MKSAIKIPLIMLLAAVLAASASAADTVEYSIDELGISVEFPDSMITFTQDINPNNPNLAILGTDEQALEDYYKTNNIYLDSFSADFSCEIYIYSLHNSSAEELGDFKDYTASEMEANRDMFTESLHGAGFDSVSSEVYDQGQTKFIKLNFIKTHDGKKLYGLAYYTAVGGSNIYIYAYDYVDEISSEQDKLVKEIIDSISFAKYETSAEPASPSPAAESTPQTYYDTKVTFTVPVGWEKDVINTADDIYKAKYKNSAEDVIMYGQMTLTTNSDSLNTDEIKTLLKDVGLDVSEVSTETINQLKYYKLTGETFGVFFINHIRISSRVMYFFNFYSSLTDNAEASEGYQDYERFLSSISFTGQSSGELPPINTPANNVTPSVYSPPGELEIAVTKTNPTYFIIGAALLAAIVTIVLVISQANKKQKKAVLPDAAYSVSTASTDHCPYCHKPMHSDQRYCLGCGNDIMQNKS